MITIEHINAVHKSMWEDATERHGDKFKVPSEEVNRISQRTRGLYVLMGWNGIGSPARLLSSYSIPTDIIAELVEEYYDETVAIEELTTPRPKRADKYDALLDWAKGHLFEQYTTEQLVEVSGFSYPTTLKFLQDSPTFRKVKKGLWEVRDAVADKKADKS
jgi:hypothetical protein